MARRLGEVAIAADGTVLHLRGYGMVKVFRIDATDCDTKYWATDDLAMDARMRRHDAELSFAIESYHWELTQGCAMERRQARSERNHIGLAIRAILHPEWHFFSTGVSGFEVKQRLIREAVRSYLAAPFITSPKTTKQKPYYTTEYIIFFVPLDFRIARNLSSRSYILLQKTSSNK